MCRQLRGAPELAVAPEPARQVFATKPVRLAGPVNLIVRLSHVHNGKRVSTTNNRRRLRRDGSVNGRNCLFWIRRTRNRLLRPSAHRKLLKSPSSLSSLAERSANYRRGFWSKEKTGTLEQLHLSIRAYQIGSKGQIGVRVRVADPRLWEDDRPEAQNAAEIELQTSYAALERFGADLEQLTQSRIEEAILQGEHLA